MAPDVDTGSGAGSLPSPQSHFSPSRSVTRAWVLLLEWSGVWTASASLLTPPFLFSWHFPATGDGVVTWTDGLFSFFLFCHDVDALRKRGLCHTLEIEYFSRDYKKTTLCDCNFRMTVNKDKIVNIFSGKFLFLCMEIHFCAYFQ